MVRIRGEIIGGLIVLCVGFGIADARANAGGDDRARHEHGALADKHAITPKVERVIGPGAEATGHGLYRARLADGKTMLTHGPDPQRSAPAAPTLPGLGSSLGFAPGDPERRPMCSSDFYIQVLYARVKGSPNRLGTVKSRLQESVRRTNAVLNSESLASGGGSADLRVLCDGAGKIRVDSFTSSGTSFAAVASGARAAGFQSNRADYLIFLDAEVGSSCGVSSYQRDERLTATNASNTGGGYALVYSDCWSGEAPLHEIGHTMGAVQRGAPRSTGSGAHCVEEADVMCYSPDGGDRNQNGPIANCNGRARFDCNFDDYFDAAPESGEYLSTHWNLGSPLNRFIAFGGKPASPSAVNGVVSGFVNTPDAGSSAPVGSSGGDWRIYTVKVRRGTRALRVMLDGPPAAGLELYLRRKRPPSESEFSCHDRGRSGRAVCTVNRPRPGRWYAGVHSIAAGDGAAFKLKTKLKR